MLYSHNSLNLRRAKSVLPRFGCYDSEHLTLEFWPNIDIYLRADNLLIPLSILIC